MAMKKTVLLWTCVLFCVSGQAQGIDGVDLQNDINAIKRDTSYIYAESTMKDAIEAQSGARAILELKLYDWLRIKHPQLNADSLVNLSKENWLDLVAHRGNYNRAFVYVSKQTIVPVQKHKERTVEDPYSQQDKINFIKRMYNDIFENIDFDEQNLSDLLKYFTPDVAERLHDESPYDGFEGETRYVVEFLEDGNPSYYRLDYGHRVVTRSIKPLKYDWFEITNIWDVLEDEPVIIGLKIQNTEDGLKVVDFSSKEDNKTDGLSEVDNTIEDWEFLITPEEQKMISMVNFYEIEPYIKQLKAEDRLRGYGKYSTMSQDDICHLFIYNREGEIVTVLFKTRQYTYNLKTREKDAISNYKGCGAIWFTLRK